jgi:hypothetical protein
MIPGQGHPAWDFRRVVTMKNLPLVIGGLMLLAGAVFTFQGLGVLKGSQMTGESFWAVVGPLIAGLGVALMIVGVQNRRRR